MNKLFGIHTAALSWNLFIILSASMLLSVSAFAQTVTISGLIQDELGEALPGVSIVEKGTNNGVASDFDGKFTISANVGNNLVFSYIGFLNQTVSVTGSKIGLSIVLQPDISTLDEVVVVGYGVQKKESVVGAISQLDGEALVQRGTVANVSDALSGAIPGVTVLSSTGIPGGSPNTDYGENSAILIRGRSTFNSADSSPLVLVDGVERDFNDLDPNDIETLSVLKDASATAVFGVKGGNGVILITTKRGKTGAPVFRVDGNYTFKSISRIPKVLEGYRSSLAKNRAIIGELATNPSSWSDYTTSEELGYLQSGEFPYAYPNVDWQDVMLNDYATSFKTNLSVSGGSDFVKYYGSLGFLRDGDIFATEDVGQGYDPNFQYDRFNYRSNLDFNLTETTKLTVNLAGSYGSQQRPDASQFQFWFGVYAKPWTTPVVQYPDGVYGQGIDFERLGQNEYAELNFNGTVIENRSDFNAGIKLNEDLKYITPGLSFLGEFGYDIYTRTRGRGIDDDGVLTKYVDPAFYLLNDPDADINDFTDFIEPNVDSDGFEFTNAPLDYQNEIFNQNLANRTRINILGRFSLNYNRTFGKHTVGGLALFSRESQKDYSTSGFPIKREDYTGRVTYNFNSRYNVEISGSYNGSDVFGPDFRYDFFPAIGLGWTMSNENWFEVAKPIISNLKFRYSDGVVGNDRIRGIPLFPYLTQFGTGGAGNGYSNNGTFGDTNPIPGPEFIRESVIGNPNLRWESARKSNYGVDMGLFNNSLSMSMDLFQERREDILIGPDDRQVPDFFGAAPPVANVGIVENKGYEFTITYTNSIGDFNYDATFAKTYVKDKIIFREDPLLQPAYQQQAGFQIGQNRGTLQDGIVKSWDEIYTGVLGQDNAAFLPGDFRLIDYNADGVIDFNDNVAFGFPNRPQHTYNFILGGDYRGFNITMNFYGQYNVTQTVGLGEFDFNAPAIYQSQLDATFSPEYGNEDPTFRALRYNRPNVSNGNFYQRDGSFLRLKNAEMGYSLPSKFIERFGLNGLRLFVNGNNLWLWSDLPVDIEGTNFDVRNYPVTKQVNFGFTATF